jgi:molecular chaperone IbpA
MRTVFDFSPYRRSTVGFDRLFDTLEAAARGEASGTNYPPYDIESTGDDSYRITLAVAGFSEGEIELTAQQNLLVVSAKKADAAANDDDRRYLHRGIATRAFERRFQLADHVRVKGASLTNGMLAVDLVREVPEAMKPRKIAIGGANVTAIEGKARKAA